MSENEFLDCLAIIGNVCTKKELERMKYLKSESQAAERSSVKIRNFGMTYARTIGMDDKIVRLDRNIAALSYLLSMAYDITDSIRSEITEILLANENYKQEELKKRKETIEKLSQKKYNDNKK